MARAREHEPQLGPGGPQPSEGVEEPGVVLVRPRPRGVVEERLPRVGLRGAEARVVDAEMDRVDALGVEAEPLDDAGANPVADHDHPIRARGGPVVREASKEALAAREELRQVQMLDVEEGQHRRAVGRRHRHGERVVHDVRASDALSQGAGPHGGSSHRRETPRGRGRGAIPGRDDRLEPAAGIRREGRHERLVLVGADARQRVAELAGVRLAAAGDAGHEGQEREGDAHPRILG